MNTRSIQTFFDRSQALWKASFPDLFFVTGERGRPLTIRVSDLAIVELRFSLPKFECLHLGRIDLIAARPGIRRVDNTLALVSGEYVLSSVLPGTEGLLQDGWVNGQQIPWVGFHTKYQNNPFAILSLSNSTLIRRIEIHNRNDEYAARTWGLKVEAAGIDGEWKVLYDSTERADEFVRLLREAAYYEEEEIPLPCEIHLACRLIRLVCTGNLRELEAELHADDAVSHESKVEIQRHISSIFLSRIDLEWTRHGIAKTFRYWTHAEKYDYISQCAKLGKALSQISSHVSFGYGSVLSFVRERDLMPHDDDLDLIIAFPRDQVGSVAEGLRRVEDHLRQLGYVVGGDYASHRQVAWPGKKDCDVFVGLIEEQFVSWLPGSRGAFQVNDLFPPIEARFLGIQCPFPRNPFLYLEGVYGPLWASPIPGWSHDWSISEYQDIL